MTLTDCCANIVQRLLQNLGHAYIVINVSDAHRESNGHTCFISNASFACLGLLWAGGARGALLPPLLAPLVRPQRPLALPFLQTAIDGC